MLVAPICGRGGPGRRARLLARRSAKRSARRMLACGRDGGKRSYSREIVPCRIARFPIVPDARLNSKPQAC